MSAPSFANAIIKRPWLYRIMKPIANWYTNAAGYRQMGLRADDLIIEENDTVQKALKRLSPQESYDRVYRIRRAIQLSLSHQILPKEQYTKDEEDIAYLSPIIRQIEAEEKERGDLDSLMITKRSK
ncbi:Cytochrome b-c1 complex subunit 7 [Venustampulla echinocandica]|uniref:Cytochrome b-c1 complex subunit 7 n=1 Tax=Venustampulla echinocandica TaxID=2656787 RepID=A0A370TRB5_9HELO|nr:Cytochrome b-c1 complex subunit 7 [Venustampulla echinocandica]RDL38061.1 Cytochrome b-c1 complex subunit 7 [Venustampulla echinocandica]